MAAQPARAFWGTPGGLGARVIRCRAVALPRERASLARVSAELLGVAAFRLATEDTASHRLSHRFRWDLRRCSRWRLPSPAVQPGPAPVAAQRRSHEPCKKSPSRAASEQAQRCSGRRNLVH